ncbi:hypothetical protein BAUCODRAFT_127820 [Baudoinia panamericana UAMH 10762]|uniref:Uncharacterized protein n=1 Tax=Baudoinia panamericana (strain UAMH 10762) TaxID=717646 RepID=M2N957_BAUPA|nr:uncharacterized protein BAUCODRAFT_127820 [Baudoinia panamericana UAMH 10762]EMD00699.1 hypothetical protein BAUCODRAFT_127820 [Baudoinia panamericana UAMH 10762]
MTSYGDDGYDYDRRRRRSPQGYHDTYRRQQYLNPGGGGGLQRSRSQGHGPTPNIYIYNDQVQDANQRASSPGLMPIPVPAPAPPQAYPQAYPQPYPVAVPYPASPEMRGRRHDLVEDLAEMAILEKVGVGRSRSRGRSDVALVDRPDFYEWRLEQKERELEEQKRRQLWEKEAELRRMRDEARRHKAEEDAEAEKKRIISDWEDRKRKEAAAAKDAEIKAIEKMERERKEAKEAEVRALERLERDKREAREEEERIRDKIEREKIEAKAKKERERQEFLREEWERAEKKKAEAKAEKEKLEHEMRKRLEAFGVYSQAQIDFMVSEESAKKLKEERDRPIGRVGQIELWKPVRPVYPKVHRDYLSVDTLIYYDIEYEIDRADPNYIIIRREMDRYETEVLFEHTRRLRAGDRKLLIEAPKKEKNYAWYRKRDRSSSRVRQVGILEVKKII